MDIGQVSHCQAQPVGLKQGDDIIGPRPPLQIWLSWRFVPSLNEINQVILSPWATAFSCVMPTLHNGPDLPHRNCPFPGGRGCRSGPHLTQYAIELAKANRRALQNGISIQSSCLSTAHECDRHTRRTDGHSCSSLELELEAVWLRSRSAF